jgi:hypothetical protein
MKKLIWIIIFFAVVSLITAGIVLYARGYRPNLKNGSIEATGVVSIKSKPDGATVFVNGEEKGSTNLDLPDLKPGIYNIEIVKDGFSSWVRDVEVKKENLNLIEATLFPTAPSLRALTYTGVNNPVAPPKKDKIAFSLLEPEEKAGIWVLNLSTSALPSFFTKDLTLVAADSNEVKFSSASYQFSPDGKQLLVTIGKNERFFLIDSGKENEKPKEVTLDVAKIRDDWKKKTTQEREGNLSSLGKKAELLAATLTNLSFSPDNAKFLGRKNNGVAVLYNSDPSPAPNQEPQIYNLPKAESYIWYPDSEHVILVKDGSISIVEADGKNNVVIYTGSFEPGFLTPWPDGRKIVIATSLNTQVTKLPNLYSIELQ